MLNFFAEVYMVYIQKHTEIFDTALQVGGAKRDISFEKKMEKVLKLLGCVVLVEKESQ